MGQQRIYQGHVYEQSAPGQPWVMIGPATAGPQSVTIGTRDPTKTAKARADLERTQQEVKQAEATAGATTRKTEAEAKSAEIKAKADQEAYDAKHPKGTGATVFGDAFLQTLPRPDQEVVKALSEGRLAFPGSFALKSPFWQEKLEQVAQYDPNFDATNYNTRAKARAALVNGKLGASSNALNTAIGHVGHLAEQGTDTSSLGGFPFATDINSLINAYNRHAGGAGVTNFEDTAAKLADELESAYRNGGGAEQGVVRQLRSLDPNMSAKQKQGIIRNALELLSSKQAANLYQLNISTGGKPSVDLLDPAAHAVLDKFPDIRDKYFAPPEPQGFSKDAAALITAHGGEVPPSGPAASGGGGNPGGPSGAPPIAPGGTGPLPGSGPSPWDNPDTRQNVATDPFQRVDHPEMRALVASMVNAGSDLGTINGALAARHFPAVTPQQYAAVQTWMKQNPGKQYPASAIDASTYEPLSLMQRAVDSPEAAFAVKATNAFDAGLPGLLTGEKGRGTLEAMDAAHPTASILGDLAGTTAGTFALGSGLTRVGAKVASPTVAKLLANPLTAETAFGSTYGATQNPNNPWEGALVGASSAVVGHGLGSLAAKGAPVLFGVRKAADPLSRGERAVFDATQTTGRDDVAAALAQANELGVPATLADVSPEVNSLTGAALRRSPSAAGDAREMLQTRGRGQYDRFLGAVQRDLGPIENIPQRSEDLITQAKAAAGPLYEKAYAAPGASAITEQIAPILNRPSMRGALGRARLIAAEEGRDPTSLGFELDGQGNTVLTRVPSWQTLDYAKRGLDDVLEGYRDKTTGKLVLDEHGRAIDTTRRNFLGIVDAANPDYAAARAAYATPAAEREALQRGMAATSTTPDQLSVNMGKASPSQTAQMRLGFQSDLARRAGDFRYSTNPFESILGTPAMEQRLATMYPEGGDSVARLLAQRDLERQLAASSNRLVGNSLTAERQVADQAFGGNSLVGDIAQGLAETAITGAPTATVARSGLGRGLGRAVRDWRQLGIGSRATALADEIAPIALNNDPAAAANALDDIAQRDVQYREVLDALLSKAQARGGRTGAILASDLSSEMLRR